MSTMTFVGRIGRDAEVRYTPSGEPVTNLAVAYNYGRKGQDGKKPTQWVDAALFGKRAESMAQYLTKGQPVTVVGTISEREFTDKNTGHPRKAMDVRVNDVALQGGKRDDSAPAPQRQARQQPAPKPAMGDFDEDIPF